MFRKVAPPLCFKTHVKIFLLALFGVTTCMNLYLAALGYTTATVSSAITNSLPVVTFVSSLLFRREIVNLRSFYGRIKIFGIAICAAGIAILALYKGPTLKFLDQQHPIYKEIGNSVLANGARSKKWIMGSLLTFLSIATWAVWLNLQGVFVTAITFWGQAWCIEKKGPVFTAMFMPLCLLITISLSGLLLGEHSTVGSVLGGVMMVIGLYSVLWGKSKEDTISKVVEGKEGGENKEHEEFKTIDEHEKECLEVKVTI